MIESKSSVDFNILKSDIDTILRENLWYIYKVYTKPVYWLHRL